MKAKRSIIFILIGVVLVMLGMVLTLKGCRHEKAQTVKGAEISVKEYKVFSNPYLNSMQDRYGALNEIEVKFSSVIKEFRVENRVSEIFIYPSSQNKFEIFTAGKKSDSIKVSQEGASLVIIEEKSRISTFFSSFKKNNNSALAIGIPDDLIFETVFIDLGAGKSYVEGVKCDSLFIQTGFGQVELVNINAEKGEMKTGVGETILTNAILSDFQIDTGVGKLSFNGELKGKSFVRGGIGEIILKIDGARSDYYFDGKSGIGHISVKNQNVVESIKNIKDLNGQDKPYSLFVECGIGDVLVEFMR